MENSMRKILEVIFRVLFLFVCITSFVLAFSPSQAAQAAPEPEPVRPAPQQFRPLYAPTPSLGLTVPGDVMIGQQFTFTATFDNTGTNTGYGPFIDLVFPATGADGVYPGTAPADLYDGITFVGASYLGATIPADQIYKTTFPDDDGAGPGTTGCVDHPVAVQPASNLPLPANPELPRPYEICGKAGDQLVTIILPFGSFVPTQPPADVLITAQLSNLADLTTPLGIRGQSGFQFGATPINDFCCSPYDATIPVEPGGIYNTAGLPPSNVAPTVMTLAKTYIGPESETATGPNFPRQFRITVDIADGQPITNLVINDVLPANIQYVSLDSVSPADTVGLRVLPSTSSPGGTLSVTIPSVTGGPGAADASLLFTYYVDRAVSGTPIIPPGTGAQNTSENSADTSGAWTPIDPRDRIPPPTATADCGTPCVTVEDQSIVVQKSVSNETDTNNSPGDILEYTLEFQISDFFGFQNINLTDVFTDGQRYYTDATYKTTLTLNGNPATQNLAAVDMDVDHVDIACEYTGASAPSADCDTAPGVDEGKTTVVFNLSEELAARFPLNSGQLLGGCVDPTRANNPPLCTGTGSYNDLGTTGTIIFHTKIQDQFTDLHLVPPNSNDASVDHGDVLGNDVDISGGVLDISVAPVGGLFSGTGGSPSDDSSAEVTIAFGALDKTIYAVNGNITIPGYLSPGDVVTYRLKYSQPASDFEETTLTDYLPLPVFDSTTLTTFTNSICGFPAAGVICLGSDDTYHNLNSRGENLAPAVPAGNPVVTPTRAVDGAANSLTITYPEYDSVYNISSTFDILFSVTVKNDPFADGLFLTNQANASEGTTNAGDQTLNEIVQIKLGEPNLRTAKTAVSSNHTPASELIFTPDDTAVSPAGLIVGQFDVPPGAGAPFSGSINSGNLSSDPADLTKAFNQFNSTFEGVDGGDLVKYAIVVENRGHSQNGAYDIVISDIKPPEMDIPAGSPGLNLQITRGDGTALQFEVVNFGADGKYGGGDDTVTPGDASNDDRIFDAGYAIRVVDPTSGVDAGKGACQVHDTANGKNVVVVTYDMKVKSGLTPAKVIVNTTSLHNYSGSNGGPNFLPTPIKDSAPVIVGEPAFEAGQGKTLVSTELDSALDATIHGNSKTQAAIGELATYQLEIILHEGLLPNAQLVDTLDAGLSFVRIDSVAVSPGVTVATPPGTGTTPANVTIGSTGGGTSNLLTFNFGDITDPDTNDIVNETITIVYTAVVTNVIGNQAGTSLNNSAVLTWTDGTTPGSKPAVSAPNVTVIEPALTVDKNACDDATPPCNPVASLDAGDPLTYIITVTNSGTTDAYDVSFTDPLPRANMLIPSKSWFTPNVGTLSVILSTGSIDISSSFEIVGSDANGWILQTKSTSNIDLAPGEIITITLSGTIDYAAPPNANLTNTGTALWTSLNGDLVAHPQERTGTNPVVQPNDYVHSNTVVVNITNPLILTKTLVSTSEAHTSGSDVAIGEIVRYRLKVRVPESTSYNLQLLDELPDGLTFLNDDTARMAFVCTNPTPPCSVTSTAITDPPASWVVLNANVDAVTPTYILKTDNVSNNATSDVDVYSSGTDVYFKFGNLTNNANDLNDEYVLVEFNALVDNSIAGNNNNGDPRTNDFIAYEGIPSARSGIETNNFVPVTIREPNIPVTATTKQVLPLTGDAGDPVTYTVTYTNLGPTATADAFEVRVLDTLPSYLDLTAVNAPSYTPACSSPTASNNSNLVTDIVDVTVDRVRVGCTVTFTYNATLRINVAPSQLITNQADLTYTSLPGTGTPTGTGGNTTGSTTPGASGSDTGERNGTGTNPPNKYRGSDQAVVNPLLPSMTKSVVATELNVPGNDPLTQAVVGELITYELVITVPEGTTPALQVVDTLDAGLAFVDCASVTASAALSTNLPGGFAAASVCNDGTVPGTNNPLITSSGGVATFTFGTVTNSNIINAVPETITVRYTVVPLNILANQNAPATLLDNSAVLSWTGGSQAAVSAPVVTIVEPTLTIAKSRTVNGSDAGDITTFSITVSNLNAASDTFAYDAVFSDIIPTGLTYVVASATPAANCTTGAPAPGNPVFSYDGPSRTLFATWTTFPRNTACTFTFNTTLDIGIYPGQTIAANTGRVDWTSIPGTPAPANRSSYNANSTERTGADGIPGVGVLNDYRRQNATGTFNVTNVAPQKTVIYTSETHTAVNNVAIGEIVRYRLVLQLPESTTTDLQLMDTFAGTGAGQRFLDNVIPATTNFLFVGNGNISSAAYGAGAGLIPAVTCPNYPGNFTLAQAVLIAQIPSLDVNCSLADANISTSETINADVYNTNTTPRFKLGTVTNSDNDANNEFVIIEFNALVTNEANNITPRTLTDTFQARRYNGAVMVNLGGVSAATTLTIREPSIPFSLGTNNKIASPTTGYDAGDTVPYTITYTNTGTSDAFEARIEDTLNGTYFTLNLGSIATDLTDVDCSAVSPTVTNISAGNKVDVTVSRVPVNCTVVIQYTAALTTSVAPLTNYVNTATLNYSSLPGTGTPIGPGNPTGSVTPGGSGAVNGERNGTGANPPNNYRGSDDAQITTANVTPIKSIISTSEASTLETGDGSNNTTNARALAIGEIMRYRLAIALPEGTSTNFVVTDTLPTGLTFMDGTLKLAYWANNNVTNVNGTANTDLAGANNDPDSDPPVFVLVNTTNTYYTYNGGSRLLTIDLYSPVNNDLNDGNAEYVVLEFNVLVNNDATNNNTTIHDNLFNVTINAGLPVASNHIYSRVDEPKLNVTKVDDDADGLWVYGQTPVTYTIQVSHVSGDPTPANNSAADAFDIIVTDVIPAGLTYVGTGALPPNWSSSYTAATRTLTWTCNSPACSMPLAGGPVNLTYQVTVNDQFTTPHLNGDDTAVNTVNLTWTSLPGTGTTPNGTGSTTPGGSGAVNGERNGTGANPPNNSTDSAIHTGELIDYYSIGNRVWFDTNNNSVMDAGEVGVPNVDVELYAADGSGNPTGSPYLDTTNASGFYMFDYLLHGDYVVVIPAGELDAGGTLQDYWSSGTSINGAGVISETPAAPVNSNGPDGTPNTFDDDIDVDDNGTLTAGRVISSVITLGPNGLTEHTGEVAAQLESGVLGNQGAQPDGRANMTADFGFYKVEIGNLVFYDQNANGVNDGADTPLTGVTVRLFASNGTTEIITGADGILGTADDLLGPDGIVSGDDGTGGVITGGAFGPGQYKFSGLPAGNYIIKVLTPTGMLSTVDTAGTPNPEGNINNDDNGIGISNGLVTSGVLTMTGGEVRANITLTDATGVTYDHSVDFGFVDAYALGNRVWFDTNNNGLIDAPAEVGVNGVTVELYRADGAGLPTGLPVATDTTSGDGTNNGYYLFDYLVPGDYVVVIPTTNFASGAALDGYWSSLTTRNNDGSLSETSAPDADTVALDTDDNGTRQTAAPLLGAVISKAVTLGLSGNTEPTGETDVNTLEAGVDHQGDQPDGRAT
jgi:uncharacterized repeat protein (TIGR01451 family)/fimbrial isopeptide formation D2 family protein